MNNSRTELYDSLHNPPAFPTDTEHQPNGHVVHLEGMTLRDYFAAKAMAGDWAADAENSAVCHFLEAEETSDKGEDLAFSRAASYYYSMADAMLEARQACKEAA